jgi:hypothetical protein
MWIDMFKHFKDFFAIFIAVLSALGIGIMLIFHEEIIKIVRISLFYVFIFLFIILLVSISIFKKRIHAENENRRFRKIEVNKKWFYLLTLSIIVGYVFSLFFDIFGLNFIYYSTILFTLGLVMSIALTKYSYRLALFCVLFLFLSYLIAIYAFYPPSLGNDTWRDINVALIITKSGYVGGVTNVYYQFPLVSITYAIISLILNISLVNSTVLMGILYILISAVLAFLISSKLCIKLNTFSAFMTVILMLSIPLITLWSVAFVTEAYAFIMFLCIILILFSKVPKINVAFISAIPLLIALVFGHGGVDLWCICFLGFLIIVMSFMKVKHDNSYLFIKGTLLILIPITVIYFIYAFVVSTFTTNIYDTLQGIINFISQTAKGSTNYTISAGSPIDTALFGYGPLAICAVVAFIAWLGNEHPGNSFKDIFLEAAFIYSLAMVIVALIGTIYFPEVTLDRYLGLGSILLFSIIASVGFREFLRRGLIGKFFVGFLSALLIASIVFGGTITPDFNPFNVQTSYTVKAPPNWSDVTSIAAVVSYLNNGAIVSDWRTGLPITSSFYNEYSVQNVTATSSGYTIDTTKGIITITYMWIPLNERAIESYINNNGFFIYRPGALENLNLLVGINETQIHSDLLLQYDLVFSGPIEVITQ